MSALPGDVALFNTIDQLIRQQEEEDGADRRVSERRPFVCLQLLAPFDGNEMPTPSDFSHVRCQDLSPGGFSYYAEARPAEQRVIIALGRVPFLFAIAEVMHTRPCLDDNGYQFLVGCRFEQRLSSPQ